MAVAYGPLQGRGGGGGRMNSEFYSPYGNFEFRDQRERNEDVFKCHLHNVKSINQL